MDDQALTWIARLRSDHADESDHQAFALWLAANPAHGRAMDRMQNLWDDLGAVSHLPFEEGQGTADISPVSDSVQILATLEAILGVILMAGLVGYVVAAIVAQQTSAQPEQPYDSS